MTKKKKPPPRPDGKAEELAPTVLPMTVRLSPESVRLPSGNPNRMDGDEYDALVASIRKNGFLQPILVRMAAGIDDPADSEVFDLIDGEHRLRAAVEIGLPEVLAVVVPHDVSDDVVRVLRIGMNRLRGQLDVSAVAREFRDLVDHGWSVADLETTGFDASSIDALLRSLADVDPMAGAPELPEDLDVDADEKTYSLTIRFPSEADRLRVKAALLDVGEHDLARGAVRLVERAEVG